MVKLVHDLFNCNTCEKIFSENSTLKMHNQTIHELENFNFIPKSKYSNLNNEDLKMNTKALNENDQNLDIKIESEFEQNEDNENVNYLYHNDEYDEYAGVIFMKCDECQTWMATEIQFKSHRKLHEKYLDLKTENEFDKALKNKNDEYPDIRIENDDYENVNDEKYLDIKTENCFKQNYEYLDVKIENDVEQEKNDDENVKYDEKDEYLDIRMKKGSKKKINNHSEILFGNEMKKVDNFTNDLQNIGISMQNRLFEVF